jgi:hypothetical protein
LGRLLGDKYPANNLVDESLDEPNGPGGRMLDLSYANDDNKGYDAPGLGLPSNSTLFDYRSVGFIYVPFSGGTVY